MLNERTNYTKVIVIEIFRVRDLNLPLNYIS